MNTNKPMISALNILGRRDATEAELRKKLTEREYSADEIEATIKRLHELNLISENDVAEQITRAFPQKGDRWIEQKMKRRGVDMSAVKKAMATNITEEERIKIVAEKKWSKVKGRTEDERVQKLARFLAGRGFALDLAWGMAKKMREMDKKVENEENGD